MERCIISCCANKKKSETKKISSALLNPWCKDRYGIPGSFPFLNPTIKGSDQIAERLIVHKGYSKKLVHEKVIEIIRLVVIPDPISCCTTYPHQLSGRMRHCNGYLIC
ncbi:hypothetical protein J2S25_002943 [Mesobacillus stamsii]|uniref:Uncharacterized protein n=1 Tax=Mesobacillus stamsii TaxID=225347 RepID=A0ABU0FXS6_9BACI|nr:hypothetical protein [Mesobacillus stamsii]